MRKYRLTVRLLPGELVPDGRFDDGEFAGEISREWQWSRFGAIYPVGKESITVEEVETLKTVSKKLGQAAVLPLAQG
jgi:hypothetical protein